MSRGPIQDKPRHRPSVTEIQPLVDAYYKLDGFGVGGDLHVVLDDDNWNDETIRWCIDHAGEHDPEVRGRWTHITQSLGRLLLMLTRTQRNQIDAGYDGVAMSPDDLYAECVRLEQKYAASSTPKARET